MTMAPRIRLALFAASIALSLVSAVSYAVTAHGGSRIGDRVPSKLWKAYPLDPSGRRPPAENKAPDAPRFRTIQVTRSEVKAAEKPWVTGLVVLSVLGCGGVLLFLGDVGRRRLRGRDSKRAPRRGQEEEGRHRGGETPVAVDKVSRYSIREDAVKEKQPQPQEDHVEGTSGVVAPDDAAEFAGSREPTSLTAVGEEVQAVLSSAHDAASTIRRKAEKEAERIRNDAWSAAKAEIAEATRIAAAHRDDAERIRAEAETSATEAKAAAEAFAEELRTRAESEAARIEQEARERLNAADADAAQKVEQAEADARERFSVLGDGIKRHEERLQNLLVILRGMSSQVEAFLERREASDQTDEIFDETLEDALRLDHSPKALEVSGPEQPAGQ